MRFCPFCAQENPDDARECVHCGKRLPVVRAAPSRVPAARAAPAARPYPARPAAPAPRTFQPDVDTIQQPRLAPEELTATEERSHKSTLLGVTAVAPARPHVNGGLTLPTAKIDDDFEGDEQTIAEDPPTAETKLPAERVPTPILDGPTSPTPRLEGDTDSHPLLVDEPPSSAGNLPPRLAPPPSGPPSSQTLAGRAVSLPPPPSPMSNGSMPAVLAQALIVPTLGGALESPSLPGDPSEDASLGVPPMPAPPEGTQLLPAVKYLWPLGRAIWARGRAQKQLRASLHDDQRLLDGVLGELGRIAREEKVELPAVADEMRRVAEEEERRTRADNEAARIDMSIANERDRFAGDESTRLGVITERQAELRGTEEELKQRAAERAGHAGEQGKLDGKIRAAEKRAAQAEAKAQKLLAVPPEKGGGPNAAANVRIEVQAAQQEAAELMPARDVARARAEALDAPMAALTEKASDTRGRLKGERAALAEAQAAHQRAVSVMQGEKRKAEEEREAAIRELAQRFVAAGTILQLHRVEGSRFVPLYQRIDELKATVSGREATVVRLEAERRAFDRVAVQRGLIVVGVALGALALLTIILAVLLSR